MKLLRKKTNYKYYKPTYVFIRKTKELSIPQVLCDKIYSYVGDILHKVKILQRAWRRYDTCHPYIREYFPHVDYVVNNMYPLESKYRILRQSNSGVDKWRCHWGFMGWGQRTPYWYLAITLYSRRLIHYGYEDLPINIRVWENKKVKKWNGVETAMPERKSIFDDWSGITSLPRACKFT
jgi:hypothetical protein